MMFLTRVSLRLRACTDDVYDIGKCIVLGRSAILSRSALDSGLVSELCAGLVSFELCRGLG